MPQSKRSVKTGFKDLQWQIILEGKRLKWVANRPIISDRLRWSNVVTKLGSVVKYLAWMMFRLPIWKKLTAAIRNQVKSAFDLMGKKDAIDSFLDFAKFLIPIK